ncbi:hypothetical protein FA048_04710 [Pedobacter polaris]|uniref:Uncharacterized protein n=1 Tax=Pedobacter polaris TaxID=2571273 RepID=A0A4U1CVP7_9SPHI|nr:DUF6252 family protein [Pedobacter polaris]TKC12923.1 hypothetical protein FA048_04710 [Pedobacter polaris]
MKKITTILLVFTILTTVFISCKKDEETTVKAAGTASADLKVGSAASVAWVATTATATKAGTSYTITAINSTGTLVIKLDNVTAAGTYTFTTANRNATFTTGSKTYGTLNNGGGNTIITAISADKIEGTFFCEMFDGTATSAVYCNLGNGKFSASF